MAAPDFLASRPQPAQPVDPIVVADCPEVVLRLVRQGLGLGQFCECHILGDLASGRLARVLPDWQVTEIPILAVYHDNRLIAAKVRAFVDFLARRLGPGVLVETPNGRSAA